MSRACIILALAIAVSGCEGQGEAPNAPAGCDVARAPDGRAPYHPRVLRGEVLAPGVGAPTGASGALWRVFGAVAHAMPLEGESPVAGAQVTLWRVNASGAPVGEALASATTDPQGRWCMELAKDQRLGPGLLLDAKRDALRLRQLAMHPFDLTINTHTEALIQELLAREVALDALTPERWLNLRTLSDTAVGLFGQVDARGLSADATITKARAALSRDARLSAALARRAGALTE